MKVALIVVCLLSSFASAKPRLQLAAGADYGPGPALTADVTFPVADTIAIGMHFAELSTLTPEISVRSLVAPAASMRVAPHTFASIAIGYVDVWAETLHGTAHNPRAGASLAIRHGLGARGKLTIGAELNYTLPTIVHHDNVRHDFGGFALALLVGIQSF
jgi:hypothetical protein